MKSDLMTLPGSTSATSSPGSVAGPSPCGGPDSKALPESGPAPVPVSRFRALESDRATPTSATFGPLFTRSSPSGDLQRCLASRLRARMDVNGSPEFALTWKDWDMPAGEPICALRASGRRTGDKGCSGWPTPKSSPSSMFAEDEATFAARDKHSRPGSADTLARAAQLAAWPTPDTNTCGGAQDAEKRKAGGHTPRLQDAVLLAAWPTPNTMEGGQTSRGGKRKGEPLMGGLVGWATPPAEDAESAGMRHSRGVADTLTAQAGQGLAGWQTPMASDGKPPRDMAKRLKTDRQTRDPNCSGSYKMDLSDQVGLTGPASTSCPAGTGKRGVLRPGHSRWLMGYPAAWDSCGATAMQSCRKSRRSS